ncbi:Transcription factor bHLH96 [Senna tora]|uniref:Transcription factor bHLH96 n=1 Tax=Senna tora TaxID=362788 RepID=A0A834SK75_9FABA|nr:Transcription factor bHLH96 [Senna tora]
MAVEADYPFYAYAYAKAKQVSADPHSLCTQNELGGEWNHNHNNEIWCPQNSNNQQSSNNRGECSGEGNLESTRGGPNPNPKRRRGKSRKNKEEIENQRMTHIAVERNRRKQMNHYLSLLRSLMPHSYVQRGDQASIIGGAINFVKELEQRLQFLATEDQQVSDLDPTMPFSEFFSFPQYTSSSSDIEVTMVESHANIKIRTNKRPTQLLNLVSALHSISLTILHLNVTTTHHIVLYSISVKLEEECKMGSADDIAAALHQMLQTIQQHSSSSSSSSTLNQHPS